jgi:hypothetical protein
MDQRKIDRRGPSQLGGGIMRDRILTPAIATVLSAVLLILAVDGMGAPRSEIELSWDDGSAEYEITGRAQQKLAVGFHAPETALWLTAVRVYIMDDGVEIPGDPGAPTTRSFFLTLWRPGSPGPGVYGGCPYYVEMGYPEEAWLEVELPEPVDISDEEHFPNREFYVGLTWEHRTNPVVGLDADEPIDMRSWWHDWSSWAQIDTADAMVRAVVLDSTATPVELTSWGAVKALHR